MFSKAEKNYLINIALGISSVLCIVSGFLLTIKIPALFALIGGARIKTLHEWTGYLMSGLVVLHLLTHMDWVISLTKRMSAEKRKAAAAITVVVVAASVSLGTVALSPSTGPDRTKNRQPAVTEQQSGGVAHPL